MGFVVNLGIILGVQEFEVEEALTSVVRQSLSRGYWAQLARWGEKVSYWLEITLGRENRVKPNSGSLVGRQKVDVRE